MSEERVSTAPTVATITASVAQARASFIIPRTPEARPAHHSMRKHAAGFAPERYRRFKRVIYLPFGEL